MAIELPLTSPPAISSRVNDLKEGRFNNSSAAAAILNRNAKKYRGGAEAKDDFVIEKVVPQIRVTRIRAAYPIQFFRCTQTPRIADSVYYLEQPFNLLLIIAYNKKRAQALD